MLVPLRLRHKRPQNLQVPAGQLRVPSSRPPRRRRRLRLVSISVKLARPALDNFVRFALRRLCRTSLLAHTQLIQRHNSALERTHLTCFSRSTCYLASGRAVSLLSAEKHLGNGHASRALALASPRTHPRQKSDRRLEFHLAASAILRPEPNFLRVQASAQAATRAAGYCSTLNSCSGATVPLLLGYATRMGHPEPYI